eukprot:gene13526-biopygen10830
MVLNGRYCWETRGHFLFPHHLPINDACQPATELQAGIRCKHLLRRPAEGVLCRYLFNGDICDRADAEHRGGQQAPRRLPARTRAPPPSRDRVRAGRNAPCSAGGGRVRNANGEPATQRPSPEESFGLENPGPVLKKGTMSGSLSCHAMFSPTTRVLSSMHVSAMFHQPAHIALREVHLFPSCLPFNRAPSPAVPRRGGGMSTGPRALAQAVLIVSNQ